MLERHLSHFRPFPTSGALSTTSTSASHPTPRHADYTLYNLPLFTFYFQQHRKQILHLSTYGIDSPSYHSNNQVFLCANDKSCTAYASYSPIVLSWYLLWGHCRYDAWNGRLTVLQNLFPMPCHEL
jgi:hypothetical protein